MTPRKDSIARQHVNRSHRLTHNRRVRKQFIWQFNLCGNYTLNLWSILNFFLSTQLVVCIYSWLLLSVLLQTFSEGKVLLCRFKFCDNDRVPSTHKLFFHYLEIWEFEAKWTLHAWVMNFRGRSSLSQYNIFHYVKSVIDIYKILPQKVS